MIPNERGNRRDHGGPDQAEHHRKFHIRQVVIQSGGLQEGQQWKDRLFRPQLSQDPSGMHRCPYLGAVRIAAIQYRVTGQPNQFRDMLTPKSKIRGIIRPFGRIVFPAFANAEQSPDRISVLGANAKILMMDEPTALLTDREVDVLRLLSEGWDTAEIASKLAYSERTVKNVIHDITARLQLRNRSHAVAYAVRQGLI